MTALIRQGVKLPATLQTAIVMWADATTEATSERRRDLVRDKGRVLADFFSCAGKPPGLVTPIDVKVWQARLEAKDLAPATVYARISRLSSFYEWAMKDDDLRDKIGGNPVKLARPKAPKPYQTESTQALDDEEAAALLGVIKGKTDLVGKRDYALFLFYIATGMRRSEVIRLRWKDIKVNCGLIVTTKFKGGDYKSIGIDDPRVRDALLDYLKASGRLDTMQPDTPLWTRHDKSGKPGKHLSSHSFVKNLKKYAKAAKIGDIHLHQTRHTYGRIVAEDSGSIVEVQDALGHKNLATTRVYVKRVAVKKDKHSKNILDRLGVL